MNLGWNFQNEQPQYYSNQMPVSFVVQPELI
jgi:hypothetical protein